MIYVLRTGIQWNALPKELGASSTVHDRFQEWEKQHFFQVLWQAGLAEYDEVQGIEWEWQSVDGAMSDPPLSAKMQLVPIQPIAARGEPNAVYSRMRQGFPWPSSLMEPIVTMCACSVPPWMAS